jgi:preprotein translocase subunit YajC
MNLPFFTLAQACPAPTATASPLQPLVTMVLLLGVMYLVLIRPQKRRDKARKEMIASVKSGDRVLLTSGILGRVRTVNETSLIVQIAEKTKIEVVRAAISQILEAGETPSDIEAK